MGGMENPQMFTFIYKETQNYICVCVYKLRENEPNSKMAECANKYSLNGKLTDDENMKLMEMVRVFDHF